MSLLSFRFFVLWSVYMLCASAIASIFLVRFLRQRWLLSKVIYFEEPKSCRNRTLAELITTVERASPGR
jgi:hypothetical protein